MSTNLWIAIGGIAAILLFVLLNGYFVASEFALVAVRRSRVEQLVQEGKPGARWLLHAVTHLDTYLSVVQIGITISSLALGFIGEPILAQLIEPLFGWLPHDVAFISAHGIAFAIAFFIVTYLHVVIGELIPKSIAIQQSEKTSLAIITPLRGFLWLFRPLIWVLNGSGNFFLRLMGFGTTGEHGHHSEAEIRILVRESEEAGALDEGEGELIDRVFAFADTQADQVMVPRTRMVGVPVTARIMDVARALKTSNHSRLPVYEESLDTIHGVLHVRDVASAMGWERGEESIRTIMRPVLTVPASLDADDLLREMRRKKIHMAILIDDFGGTAGLVTLEDLLEELVGEIDDEFETGTPLIRRNADGTITVDGQTPIAEVGKIVPLAADEDRYETIAGYLLERLGHIPTAGESVAVDGWGMRVERMDRLRIAEVTLTPRAGEGGDTAYSVIAAAGMTAMLASAALG